MVGHAHVAKSQVLGPATLRFFGGIGCSHVHFPALVYTVLDALREHVLVD